MSVIITGMSVPKDCWYCKIERITCPAYMEWFNKEGKFMEEVPEPLVLSDCPLRSVEGLIEEIKKMKMTSGVTGQGVWNECLHYVIENIEEYCKGDE